MKYTAQFENKKAKWSPIIEDSSFNFERMQVLQMVTKLTESYVPVYPSIVFRKCV